MPNPTTAAGWLRGIPHLDSQQIALLEVALESYARQRIEAVRRLREIVRLRRETPSMKEEELKTALAAHRAVIREVAELLDGVWVPPEQHPLFTRDKKVVLAHPLVVAAREGGGRDGT